MQIPNWNVDPIAYKRYDLFIFLKNLLYTVFIMVCWLSALERYQVLLNIETGSVLF